ncbi:MAG: hypothetical protein IT489_00955 [Gammaproteobacteria bacterium]|nr:hypothetical protein [Gammaproteobacteria bacterium]
MAIAYNVNIGNWYRTAEGRLFEVVSRDTDTIEVQYDDGDLEEFDQETWSDIRPILSPPPASAPFPFDLENEEGFGADRHSLHELLGDIDFSD